MNDRRPLAIITGASSGIGFELAILAARNRHDLVIASDEPRIFDVAEHLRKALLHTVQGRLSDDDPAGCSLRSGVTGEERNQDAEGEHRQPAIAP